MKNNHLEDLIRLALKHVHVDEQFKVQGPIWNPQDCDILNVFLDCYRDKPPHATYCIEFYKSKMIHMSPEQLAKYVEMKMRFAEDGLREYVAGMQEDSDGLQSLSVDTKDFIAAAIRKALDRTDLLHLKFAVDGKDLAFEMQKALTAASERVVFEAIDATAVREDSD